MTSSSLLHTDLYQLTMAQGYYFSQMAETPAVFHAFFRKNPFKGGYAVAAGLGSFLEVLEQTWSLSHEDIIWLESLQGNQGIPLFKKEFLNYLQNLTFSCTIEAVPEGRLVFPHEPLVRVTGPLVQAQLIETLLLNIINFQTLIATKASRICDAAKGDHVLEFGLRRAQGMDGGMSASRAAWIGGVHATSNVAAGRKWNLPVKGTHAHSWVMAFESEEEAFEKYAEIMPHNCVFLVDTYDTLEGVRRAAKVAQKLEARGHSFIGIRLDSGDLAYLAQKSREILDDAGLFHASIFVSNDLDEKLILSLKQQGAPISVWGVGTKLVTAFDEPALGGVYKLAALWKNGIWEEKVKISENAIKTSIPGILNVRRFEKEGKYIADMIFDEQREKNIPTIISPEDPFRIKHIDTSCSETLLVPYVQEGIFLPRGDLHEARERCLKDKLKFDSSILRFENPHLYPAGIEQSLAQKRTQMVHQKHGQGEIK